jgi:hypothetical protein
VISDANNCLLFALEYTRLWERKTVTVDWSEAPQGSVAGKVAFTSDELILRAEGRWAFGVTRPSAVVKWDAVTP